MRRQSRDRVPQFAAERQHQSIIGHCLATAAAHNGDLPGGGIDGFDLGDPMAHANGVKQLCQWDRGLAEIDFVIADTDVVIGIAIDDDDLDVRRPRADLLALPGGADRGP